MDVFVKYTSELYQMDGVSYMFGTVLAKFVCSQVIALRFSY